MRFRGHCSALLLASIALCSFVPVSATTVRLTITDVALMQRSDITREVRVEGLGDCSLTSITTLEVVHGSATISYTGSQGTAVTSWTGREQDNVLDGSAQLTAIILPTAIAETETSIMLSELMSPTRIVARDLSNNCYLNAQLSSRQTMQSIVIGTFASGTVWADVSSLMDEAAFPEIEIEYELLPESPVPDVRADDGSLIDMNVPYTGEALCRAAGLSHPCDFGQSSSIVSQIIFFLDQSNQILTDSQATVRIRGIRAWRTVDYTEGVISFTNTLIAMQTPGDTYFETPSLLGLRDSDCVDLVGLITANGQSVSGGVILGQAAGIGPNQGVFTFVSSLESIAISTFTFTHEVGHVIGCRHNIAFDPTPPSYAHAYAAPDGTYATVVPDGRACSSFSGCVRQPVFSKPPPFLYNGLVVGDSTIADNARRIAETQVTMANFRDSTLCSTTTPSPSAPSPSSPSTPSPTSAPSNAPTCFCFSDETTALVKGKGPTSMSQLRIGDHVLTAKGYDVIYAFGHNDTTTKTEFLRLHREQEASSDYHSPLEVTADHLIYLKGRASPVRAGSIVIGDVLLDSSVAATSAASLPNDKVGVAVTKIDKVQRHGLYAPITQSGTLFVDGTLASCYVSLQENTPEHVEFDNGQKLMSQHFFIHTALSPMRMLCIGLCPTLCDSYDDTGRANFVAYGFTLFKFVERHSLFVQASLCVFWYLVIGPLFVLETLIGPKASAWLILLSLLPLLVKFALRNWVKGTKIARIWGGQKQKVY